VDDGVAIDVLDTGHDALLELLLRCHPDVAQDRAGELGEEALDEVEPGAVLQGRSVQRCDALAQSMPSVPPLFVGNAAKESLKKGELGHRAGHVLRRTPFPPVLLPIISARKPELKPVCAK
jgi:hypothetical protein